MPVVTWICLKNTIIYVFTALLPVYFKRTFLFHKLSFTRYTCTVNNKWLFIRNMKLNLLSDNFQLSTIRDINKTWRQRAIRFMFLLSHDTIKDKSNQGKSLESSWTLPCNVWHNRCVWIAFRSNLTIPLLSKNCVKYAFSLFTLITT